ncbi:hypothetical protein ILUMI_04761 [Ignelater luminosus]|uniref:SOWAHA-C winged helix-turn-helix domain-containing protein n=1 Tax=Ignelater luminosus TaxID=2038154 RepID=A0A8K0GE86_IGNLU|nr:hypothetical protein ILUMI_04761 [Ignelater luminosus]
MAAAELSIEAIHEYFVEKGGIVANREVVKHFKPYLTDPATKDEARIKFKKYINTLATTKTEGDEKFLILRPKYSACLETQSLKSSSSLSSFYDPINSVGLPLSPSHSLQDFPSSPQSSPGPRQPPPYRPPPPPPPQTSTPNVSFDNVSLASSNFSLQDAGTPQAPPRRRSSDKNKIESNNDDARRFEQEKEEQQCQENDKQPISVKERTQKFNRLASVDDDLSPRPQKEKKKPQDKVGFICFCKFSSTTNEFKTNYV